MTGNHLLLYRLAELMLQHEQHVLPVDLLFDDEQIGDFVKSIQIDSPYQQMMLEGVLTESVRNDKLYVSFTVEGYFHYVLGEVIGDSLKNLTLEKQIEMIQNRAFEHLDFGLSYYFLTRINDGDSELINKVLKLKSCSVQALTPAIAQSLLTHSSDKSLFKHDNLPLWKSVTNKLSNTARYGLIEQLLNQLNKEISKELLSSENLPHLSNAYLNKIKDSIDNIPLQLSINFYLGCYLDVISIHEKLKSEVKFNSSELFAVASSMIDTNKFDSAIEILELIRSVDHDTIELLRLESIAYNGIQMNDNALAKITTAISKSKELNGSYHIKTAELLNLEGLYFLSNSEYQRSINSFEIASGIFKKVKGEICFEFATSVNNIGLVNYYQNNYTDAIENWTKASSLLEKYGMGNHPETALVYKNTAFCHAKLGDVSKAITNIQAAIRILNNNGLAESEVVTECEKLLNKLIAYDN